MSGCVPAPPPEVPAADLGHPHSVAPGSVLFETERLRARAWTIAHAADLFRLYGDPRVMRYWATPARLATRRA